MADKQLRSIKQHNAEAKARYDKKLLTGIVCPMCGLELRYEYESLYVEDYPKKRVYCECGYRGDVLAMPDDTEGLEPQYQLDDTLRLEG